MLRPDAVRVSLHGHGPWQLALGQGSHLATGRDRRSLFFRPAVTKVASANTAVSGLARTTTSRQNKKTSKRRPAVGPSAGSETRAERFGILASRLLRPCVWSLTP